MGGGKNGCLRNYRARTDMAVIVEHHDRVTRKLGLWLAMNNRLSAMGGEREPKPKHPNKNLRRVSHKRFYQSLRASTRRKS